MGKAKAQSSDVLLAVLRVAAGLGTARPFSEWRPLALQHQLSSFVDYIHTCLDIF